jgi:hypothetical protein
MTTETQIAGNRTFDNLFGAQQPAIERRGDFTATNQTSNPRETPPLRNNYRTFNPLRETRKSLGTIPEKSPNPISTPSMCKTGVSHA